MSEHVTHELLDRIADAFNRNDVDAIVSHFHKDGVFVNGMGPAETGDIYSGREAIRKFFTVLFDKVETISWNINPPSLIDGVHAATQWRRVAVDNQGTRTEWLGCDLYTFENQLIVKKDTYIKVVS